MRTALLVLGGFAGGLVGGVLIGARWSGSPEPPAPRRDRR